MGMSTELGVIKVYVVVYKSVLMMFSRTPYSMGPPETVLLRPWDRMSSLYEINNLGHITSTLYCMFTFPRYNLELKLSQEVNNLSFSFPR